MAKRLNQSMTSETTGGSFADDAHVAYLRSNIEAIQGSAKTCSICSKKFGFLNSESTCMRCNRILCKNCVLDKVKVVYIKSGKIESSKQKICKNCDPDMKTHQEISLRSRGFNKDSSVSIRWLQGLNVISSKASEQDQQRKIEELTATYNRVNEVQIVQPKDVKYKEFITSKMNFSYLHHVHEHLGESKQRFDEIQVSISRLINKLAGHYAWKKLPMKVDILGLFILTFASEAVTFVILQHLLDNLLPPYILQSLFLNSRYSQAISWQQKSMHFVKILSENVKEISKDKKKEILIFLEKFGLDMLSSLFINILNLQCFYFSIDQLIMTKKFDHLENTLIWIMIDNFALMKDLSSDTHEKAYAFLARTVEAETLVSLGDIIQVAPLDQSEIKEIKKEEQQIGRQRMVSVAFNPMIQDETNTSNGFFTEEDHERNAPQQQQQQPPQQPPAPVQVTHQHQQKQEQEPEERVKHAAHRHQQEQEVKAEPVIQVTSQPSPSSRERKQSHCHDCPNKDQVIIALRQENESMVEQIAHLNQHAAHQQQEISKHQHQAHEQHKKIESLEAEIVELRSSQQTSELLLKYKSFVASQKDMLEKISEQKSKMEEMFIAERETAMQENIKDKNILIEQIAKLEERRNADELSTTETTEKLNKQVQSLTLKNSKLLEDLNSEKLQVAVRIKEKEAIEESLKRLTEQHSIDAGNAAVGSDVEKENIKQLRETIVRLQTDLTESAARRKETTELFVTQNNIVYDELREQINCLEVKIRELEEALRNALQKNVVDHEQHVAEVKALKQEIDVQRENLEKEVQRVIEENRVEKQQLREQIDTIQKTSTQAQESLRAEKDEIIARLEEEIVSLKAKNENLHSEKGGLALRVVELNAAIEEKNKAIAANQVVVLEKDETYAKLDSQYNETHKQLHDTKHELHEAKEEIAAKDKQIAAFEEHVRVCAHERQEGEKAIREDLEKVQKELAEQVRINQEKQAEIEDLRAKLAKALKELAAANTELNKYLGIFKSVKQTVDEANTTEQ